MILFKCQYEILNQTNNNRPFSRTENAFARLKLRTSSYNSIAIDPSLVDTCRARSKSVTSMGGLNLSSFNHPM